MKTLKDIDKLNKEIKVELDNAGEKLDDLLLDLNCILIAINKTKILFDKLDNVLNYDFAHTRAKDFEKTLDEVVKHIEMLETRAGWNQNDII